MAIASLVLALAAVGMAVAGLGYARRSARSSAGSAEAARRSADAAADVARIERERRHEERRPRLSGHVENVDGSWRRLWVVLESAEPLTGLEVALRPGQRAEFGPGMHGVAGGPGREALSAFACDARGDPAGLTMYERAVWTIYVAPEHADPLLLDATCHGGPGERWDHVLIEARTEPGAATPAV
jgi:hypothetical protein